MKILIINLGLIEKITINFIFFTKIYKIMGKKEIKIQKEQKEFLLWRIKDASKIQPLFNNLVKILIGYSKGNETMVVPGSDLDNHNIQRLINAGEFTENDWENVEIINWNPSQCHQNCYYIWKWSIEDWNPDLYSIVTWYAFTEEDGLWREHSWLIDINWYIIETTPVKRDIYYWYILNKEELKYWDEVLFI